MIRLYDLVIIIFKRWPISRPQIKRCFDGLTLLSVPAENDDVEENDDIDLY